MAEELLFGRLVKGGVVVVKVEDGKIAFGYPEEDKKLPVKRKKGKVPAVVKK